MNTTPTVGTTLTSGFEQHSSGGSAFAVWSKHTRDYDVLPQDATEEFLPESSALKAGWLAR